MRQASSAALIGAPRDLSGPEAARGLNSEPRPRRDALRETSLTPETASPPRIVPADRKLSLATKLFYGFGSVAFGVKDNGFSYFLLIFYNQVIGLPGTLVGLALMIALVCDACIDPLDRPAFRQSAQPLGPPPPVHVRRGPASGAVLCGAVEPAALGPAGAVHLPHRHLDRDPHLHLASTRCRVRRWRPSSAPATTNARCCSAIATSSAGSAGWR